MSSINRNQEEKNHQDLSGSEGIKKMQELVDKSGICFFCTDIETNKPFSTRPMAVQKLDDEGNFWFMSSSDSLKNEEIKEDAFVQLLFKGSAYSDFLNVWGRATISRDKEKIRELWSPAVKTWFTEGVDDPRITVIKVTPEEGYYWDTKNGMVVSTIKIALGALLGKTMDDSIEGTINV